MKKIKTAEEYLHKYIIKIPPYMTISPQGVINLIKEAQLDMLEYAVNKCAENVKAYGGKSSENEYYGYGIVDKQSILKTIDEIKKEL